MIVVLSADAPETDVEQVAARAAALGWRAQVSRGAEQTIVALAGQGDRAALEEALAGVPGVDLVPIRTGREYWRARWRRRFLTSLASALGLLFLLAAAVPVVSFLVPRAEIAREVKEVAVRRAADMAPGTSRHLRLGGLPVLLVRIAPERYVALSAACTLEPACLLEWNAERAQVACPCHGCTFDEHGNVVRGPASLSLPRYRVELRGERALVLARN